jgi:hypothetical protein
MKKNAQPPKNGKPSALDSANSTETTSPLKLTPREDRLLFALMTAPSPGWITRESVDKIAGASNGPAVVMALRRVFGHDAIEMQRVEATDRDGRTCRPGRYRLTPVGHIRATFKAPAPAAGER